MEGGRGKKSLVRGGACIVLKDVNSDELAFLHDG